MVICQRDMTALRSTSAAEVRALRTELETERNARYVVNGAGSDSELEVKIKSLTEVLQITVVKSYCI